MCAKFTKMIPLGMKFSYCLFHCKSEPYHPFFKPTLKGWWLGFRPQNDHPSYLTLPMKIVLTKFPTAGRNDSVLALRSMQICNTTTIITIDSALHTSTKYTMHATPCKWRDVFLSFFILVFRKFSFNEVGLFPVFQNFITQILE